ncbi:MAG: glycosyltransferase [Acetobacteraceae bacterium]
MNSSHDQTGPRVLVLLAAYNGSAWIARQMRSILDQERVQVRIVVRDDDSVDGTPAELQRLGSSDRISLVFGTHRTGSAAQNFLTLIREHSADTFEFVALSDQDDIWYPQKLARACETLRAEGSAGYSSATMARWENGKAALLRPSGAQNQTDFLFEGAGQGCTFVMSAAFYRQAREFLLAHPELTRTVHFHDWTLYALARSWGLRWTFDAYPSVIYCQHADNDTGARGSLSGIVRRLALIRAGWYRRQLNAICAICAAAAPANEAIRDWRATLNQPASMRRKLKIMRFCLRSGRRRLRDNLVVILAAALGWI